MNPPILAIKPLKFTFSPDLVIPTSFSKKIFSPFSAISLIPIFFAKYLVAVHGTKRDTFKQAYTHNPNDGL